MAGRPEGAGEGAASPAGPCEEGRLSARLAPYPTLDKARIQSALSSGKALWKCSKLYCSLDTLLLTALPEWGLGVPP